VRHEKDSERTAGGGRASPARDRGVGASHLSARTGRNIGPAGAAGVSALARGDHARASGATWHTSYHHTSNVDTLPHGDAKSHADATTRAYLDGDPPSRIGE